MSIDVTQTVEIRRSRAQLFGLAVLQLSVAVIFYAASTASFLHLGTQLMCWLMVLMSGLYGLHSIWAMIENVCPVISIGPSGFRDRRIAPETVPWASVENLSVWKSGVANVLIVRIADAEWSRLSLSMMARWNKISTRPFGFDGLWVTTMDLEAAPSQLRALVSAYSQAYGGKV